jgi:poly(3-hydroxybutyrate) depolymerase
MRFLIALVLTLSPVSAAPTAAPSCRTPPAGVRVNVPGYADRPAFLQRASRKSPLIVAFHGLHGCPAYLQTQTKLAATAKKAGVSVLWVTAANAPGGRAWDPNQNGYAYTRAAVSAARATGIRPSKLFTLGMSNGAGMATWVACTLPEFAGAIVVAGWSSPNCARQSRQSLLVIGGQRDSSSGADTPRILADMWRARLQGCGGPKVTRSGRATTTAWRCKKAEVRAVSLAGVGHAWPLFRWYNATTEAVQFVVKH